MIRYLLRRLAGAVPLVLGIATLVFVVVHLAPGDPAVRFVSPGMSAEVAAQIRRNFRLDDPLWAQYLAWLGSILRLEFGQSLSHNRPVADVLAGALPPTLLLSGLALLVAFAVGIVLGVVQAVRQHSVLDSALSVVLLFFYSMPSFWLALMLILVFSLMARNVWEWPIWFPPSGIMDVDHATLSAVGRIGDRARHLALPVLALSLSLAAGVARYMRASMLEVIRQDYVLTARAKGLPERRIVFRHALRNALLPLLTLVGLYAPLLFGGAVFVEVIFAWPGMGRAIVDAISARDYPLVMGGSLLFAAIVVVANLLADVATAMADPRIRRGESP